MPSVASTIGGFHRAMVRGGRGAPAAGRFGLTMSVASYLPVLGLCWVAPKAAALGRAIGQGCGAEARRIFEGALLRALAAIAALSVSGLLLVVALQRRAPALAARLEPPGVLALLLLASCGAFAVQSLGVYLRAFRREPYLGLSLVTAALTLSGGLVAARLGGGAMALDYLLWNGLLALVWAATLYRKGLRASSLVAGKRLEASVSARLVR